MNVKLIILILFFVFIVLAVVAEVKMRESLKEKTRKKLDRLTGNKENRKE